MWDFLVLSTAVLDRLIRKGILIWSGGWNPCTCPNKIKENNCIWGGETVFVVLDLPFPCLFSVKVTDVYNSVWEWRFNNSNLCLAEVTHEKFWLPLGAPYTRSRASGKCLLHREWHTKCFRWRCTGSVTLSSTNWYILSMILDVLFEPLPLLSLLDGTGGVLQQWEGWQSTSLSQQLSLLCQEQYWPSSLDKGCIMWSQYKLWFSFFLYPAGKHSCYCAPWSCSTFYHTGSQEYAFHQGKRSVIEMNRCSPTLYLQSSLSGELGRVAAAQGELHHVQSNWWALACAAEHQQIVPTSQPFQLARHHSTVPPHVQLV